MQVKADNLKELTEKLIDEYSQDHTGHIKIQLEKAMNRWSHLLNRLVIDWNQNTDFILMHLLNTLVMDWNQNTDFILEQQQTK